MPVGVRVGAGAVGADRRPPRVPAPVVVNQVKDGQRRAFRRRCEPVPPAPRSILPPGGRRDLDRRERAAEHQRAVIVLHYYADLPLVEIADLVGRPPATVRLRPPQRSRHSPKGTVMTLTDPLLETRLRHDLTAVAEAVTACARARATSTAAGGSPSAPSSSSCRSSSAGPRSSGPAPSTSTPSRRRRSSCAVTSTATRYLVVESRRTRCEGRSRSPGSRSSRRTRTSSAASGTPSLYSYADVGGGGCRPTALAARPGAQLQRRLRGRRPSSGSGRCIPTSPASASPPTTTSWTSRRTPSTVRLRALRGAEGRRDLHGRADDRGQPVPGTREEKQVPSLR